MDLKIFIAFIAGIFLGGFFPWYIECIIMVLGIIITESTDGMDAFVPMMLTIGCVLGMLVGDYIVFFHVEHKTFIDLINLAFDIIKWPFIHKL